MNLTEALSRLSMARALGLGLVFAAIYYFVFFDSGVNQKNAIAAQNQQIVQLKKRATHLDGQLTRIKQYQKSYGELGGTLNKMMSYIPEKFHDPDFQKLVSEEAKTIGLSINSISKASDSGTEQIQIPKEFEELAVQVDFTGQFSQVLTFLSHLTKYKQIFIVNQFSMKASDESSQLPTAATTLVNFQAVIKAYRYKGGTAAK